jgi:hypothetical protein
MLAGLTLAAAGAGVLAAAAGGYLVALATTSIAIRTNR